MEPRECGDGAPLCAAVSDVISGISIGWNLGNSYDCHGTWFDNVRTETAWGNPLVTRDFVHFVAGLGFTAMRIPVTWYPHMDEDGTIDGEWLRRVRRVVRMVIAEGMVCILDMKHDTGGMRSYGGGWIRATKANFAQYRERVETMVRQVAEYFSQESDRLILGGDCFFTKIVAFSNDFQNGNLALQFESRYFFESRFSGGGRIVTR